MFGTYWEKTDGTVGSGGLEGFVWFLNHYNVGIFPLYWKLCCAQNCVVEGSEEDDGLPRKFLKYPSSDKIMARSFSFG